MNMVGSYHFISSSRYVIQFYGFYAKVHVVFLAHYQALFQKVIENSYPFRQSNYKYTLNSLYHGLIVDKYFRHIKIKGKKVY